MTTNMKKRKITLPEADDFSTRDESHFFDRKGFTVSGRNIQKIAVAFANADGGEFAVGIGDNKEYPIPSDRWKGATTIESFNGHLQSLTEIKPSLDMNYEFLECESRPGLVLRVTVDKSSYVHATSEGTVYRRQGAQSLPIVDPQEIIRLQFAKGTTSFEDQTLPGIPTEQISDSAELISFLSDYSPKTDPLEFCVSQNLVDFKNWHARVAAALLFHSTPSAVMPRKCAVKITRYETKENEPERDHLAEQFTVEGPSYQLIKDTVAKVQQIMSSVSVWTTDGLKTLNYPPEAIWEVIVNAIIHRDYSISDDIQILIYNDRIEVLSPGRLPSYVTIENILTARYARNPKIVRTLNRYKEPPNKDLGEGLNTTFQRMKDFGLRAPVIAERNNYVAVTLPHISLAAPSEAILRFLSKHDSIANQQARDITGIRSENLVKIEFYKLKEAGMLELIPELKGPKSAWRLTESGINEVKSKYP